MRRLPVIIAVDKIGGVFAMMLPTGNANQLIGYKGANIKKNVRSLRSLAFSFKNFIQTMVAGLPVGDPVWGANIKKNVRSLRLLTFSFKNFIQTSLVKFLNEKAPALGGGHSF